MNTELMYIAHHEQYAHISRFAVFCWVVGILNISVTIVPANTEELPPRNIGTNTPEIIPYPQQNSQQKNPVYLMMGGIAHVVSKI